MPGFISASKIQQRLVKHFYCLNGLIVGAVPCQLFTKKRIERPNSRLICLFGRGPVLVGHLVLRGRQSAGAAGHVVDRRQCEQRLACKEEHRGNTGSCQRAEFEIWGRSYPTRLSFNILTS